MLFLWIYPVTIASLVSCPRPAKSFEESLGRIELLRRGDPADLNPAAQTILLDHGQKTDQVIVFLHGFTNSPRQFKVLGEQFYQLGYTVFIPRIPRHGHQEVSALKELTAEDLVRISDEVVDIAQGLGEHVTVVGLSMGGVMAGWLAQSRSDVDQAVLIAPNFGTYRFPNFFLKPSINFLLLTPNYFIWWDSHKKQNLKRPQAVYYGFYSRALGEIRRLGWSVYKLGKQFKPKAAKIPAKITSFELGFFQYFHINSIAKT